MGRPAVLSASVVCKNGKSGEQGRAVLSTEQVGSERSTSDDRKCRRSWWGRQRSEIAERPSVNFVYRIAVGIVGAAVLALGIVAIPYPGPGWLIVFAGLGILASEFNWAHRVLVWVKVRYDAFMKWFSRQNLFIKGLGVLFTTAVVLVTLWALGTFGLAASWLGHEGDWLESPLT